MEELKKKYWDIIRRTRSSGRIAASVVDRVEESWKRYDDDIVKQALEIHIKSYPSYKENYTLGIMRNLQRCKNTGAVTMRKNRFNQFEQNQYDFETLEKELLAN
ncbi:MAG: hypothetical protein ACI4R5_00475 [Acetatifactor sp.]